MEQQYPRCAAAAAVFRPAAAAAPAPASARSAAATCATRPTPATGAAAATGAATAAVPEAAAVPTSCGGGCTAAGEPAAAAGASAATAGSRRVAHDYSTHACVRALRGQLLRRIGKKVRSSPFQNLECPTVFAILSIAPLPLCSLTTLPTTTTTSDVCEQEESSAGFSGLPEDAAAPAGAQAAADRVALGTGAAGLPAATERRTQGGARQAAPAAAAAADGAAAEERRGGKGQGGDNRAGLTQTADRRTAAAREAERQQCCPLEAASAVFVVFKGKFASLISGDIITAQDVLTIAGARCRPFCLPGGREDLYSWGARALRHLQRNAAAAPPLLGATTAASNSSSLLLQGACLTHYVTLADTHADAQIDIEPQPAAGAAAGSACEPFCISAAELLTSAVLPACLPLPQWVVERNKQAERSIFRGRVLHASMRIEREQEQQRRRRRQQQQQEQEGAQQQQHSRREREAGQQEEQREHQPQKRRTTRRQEGLEPPQQEQQQPENRRQAATQHQQRKTRRQHATEQEEEEEQDTQAFENSRGTSKKTRAEGRSSVNPAAACAGTAAAAGGEGSDEQSEEEEEDGGAFYTGGILNRRSRVEYTYSSLKDLEAHYGANFYGIVWEVTKALMPSPGGGRGRGPLSFYMNVAVFDESVPFNPGIDTAPGGGIEEYSLALKTRGSPVDIPCVSVGDIVRIHRAKVGVRHDAERQFVNIGSVLNLTSARVWPLEAWEEEPSAANTLIVGSGEGSTTVTQDDTLRIQALRYHAHQLLSSYRLFTTQYYKTLAQLRDAAATSEAYGDLIVRVVRHGMTQCCRLLEASAAAAAAPPLCCAFSWLRGEASLPESQQYDAELCAYLLLVEDASMPGGEVAVCCLSEATAEQFAASDNPLREGQWLRLRNFRWCSFHLEEIQLASKDLPQEEAHGEQQLCLCQTFSCIQPSRPDLARVTRLPSFALDVLLAEQQLQEALQQLTELQQPDGQRLQQQTGLQHWDELQHLEEVPEQPEGRPLPTQVQHPHARLQLQQTDSEQQETQLQQRHTCQQTRHTDSSPRHREARRQRDMQHNGGEEEEAGCCTCQHGRADGDGRTDTGRRWTENFPDTEQPLQQQGGHRSQEVTQQQQGSESSQGTTQPQQKHRRREDDKQTECVCDVGFNGKECHVASCRTLQEWPRRAPAAAEKQPLGVEREVHLCGNRQHLHVLPLAKATGSNDAAEDSDEEKMVPKATEACVRCQLAYYVLLRLTDRRVNTAASSLVVPGECLLRRLQSSIHFYFC